MLTDRLLGAREAAGLTRRQLAALIGVDRKTVLRAEKGDSELGAATLAAWARATGVSSDWLLELTPDSADQPSADVNSEAAS